MDSKILEAARLIKEKKNTSALTGAGISVESGIPPFRGKGGLWEKFDPIEYASIDNFRKNPEKIWRLFLKPMSDTVADAEPNDAHKGLFLLEELNLLKSIITANIDGLHQASGSKDVIEFHGTYETSSCLECGKTLKSRELNLQSLPPLCECGGLFKPDCIFFGESINPQVLERAEEICETCKVMLVIGTSCSVVPSSSIPFTAKSNGAKIIEINTEPTGMTYSITDIFIKDKAGSAMNKLTDALNKI